MRLRDPHRFRVPTTGSGFLSLKSLRSILAATAVLVLVIGAYDRFGAHSLRQEVDRLEEERAALVGFVERLKASRRVAQVDVVEQCLDESGRIVSRLRWREVRPDGLMASPIELETVGMLAYFEGFVIKFDHDLVGSGDSTRGQSLVMFRRVFGDRQMPDAVPLLDRTPPPSVVSVAGVNETPSLWDRCWSLIEDAALRAQFGVRVAQIEAPAVPLDEGQVWEVTLDAAGGLNLTLVEPGTNFIPPWCGEDQSSFARVP